METKSVTKRDCFVFISFILLLCLFCGCKPNVAETPLAVSQDLLEALDQNNINVFNEKLSPDGFVTIRNFVSGEARSRGKDTRNFFRTDCTYQSIQFGTEYWENIVLPDLFAEKNSESIYIANQKFYINIETVPTQELIFGPLYAISQEKHNTDFILWYNDRQILLSDMRIIDDLPIGRAIVMEVKDGIFYVKLIVDLL